MTKTFYPESEAAINGVLKYFRENNLLNQYISVFATATLSNYYPKYFLDITNDNFWASSTISGDKYIGFTFSQYYFKVNQYTIKQYKGEGHMIMNWKLQGSIGKEWVDIDSQNSRDFCKDGLISTFKVNKTNDYYKSFRIFSNEVSCKGQANYRIAGIELFGTLCRGDLSRCFQTYDVKVERINPLITLIHILIIKTL